MQVARSLSDGGSVHALELVGNFLTEVLVGGGGLTLGFLGVIIKLPKLSKLQLLSFLFVI